MSDLGKAVFLSYASQDAEAARRICDALRQAGVEVWFDQSELVGGDAWDQKIRRQIKECALFVPVVSANTQARLEGYFRLEWKLAAQRTHTMADAKPFLLPVVIDATRDADAHVPEEFRAVQWTRLSAGETSAKFCDRVGVLLGGQGTNYSTGPMSAVADSLPPPRPTSRRTLLIAVAVAAIFALGVLGSRVFNRPVTAESAVRVKSSELVARAWEQLNDPALARSHLERANELCERATTLDPDNADAWAAWSQVDTWYVYHGFDNTPARRDQANAKAARALRTAPGGFEPRLAQACYVTRTVKPLPDAFAKDAENTLRRLLAERPEEPRVLFALGDLLGRLERVEESAAIFDRMARHAAFAATALSEKAWLYYLAARFAEAVEPNERSLAIQPFWGNLALKAILATRWTGDLDAARAAIEGIPASQFTEGVIAYSAWHLHFLRRDPKEMLRILAAIPNDWLLAKPFLAPKAYLSGIAQAMAGNRAAAEAQWGVALQQVGQRLAANPNDFWLLEMKAEILARRGDAAAARRTFELARQLAADPRLIARLDHAEALLIGDADRAITNLEQGIRSGTRDFTAASLRLDPDLDRLRGDPRFAALLARSEADPRLAPPPAKTPAAETGDAAPQPDSKSVAVLAFANLSDDKANEYFSDGISEELINALGRVPGLTVKGGTSAFYFKGRKAASAEIAQQLGVAYLVRGSVRKDGTKVRIAARLTQASDDRVVWSSEPVTRELRDVFALQQEIARLIADNLQLKLGVERQPTKTVNPEAHRLVLEGRYFLNQRDRGFAQAERAFEQALQIDPDFADAHAGLATVRIVRASYQQLDDATATTDLARGRAAGRRALELDPVQVQAHAALGYEALMSGRAAESAEHFRQALALNPNDALAHHWHAHLLAFQGRLDLALEENARAVQLDPLSFPTLWIYARHLTLARQPAKSLEIVRRCLRLRPEFAGARGIEALNLLALGRRDEAVPILRALAKAPRDPALFGAQVVWALREAGLPGEASKLAEELQPDGRSKVPVLAAMGRMDEALAPAAINGPFHAIFVYWDPIFDPVRNDPRFRQRIADSGLSEYYAVAQATLARLLADAPR